MDVNEILKIKKRLTALEAQIQQAEGRRTVLLEELQALGASSEEEAERMLLKMDDDIKSKSSRLSRGLEQLKKDFPWND